MPSCRLRRKTAAVIVMLSLFLLSGGSAWSADAIRMDNDKLYEETRKAASDRDVLERVFKSVYQYDRLIGDAVESNYDIEPVKIIPWRTGNDSAISIVRIKATRAAKETWYTFSFVFSPAGMKTLLLYPGTSNVDPALFSDLLVPAKAYAVSALKSKDATIKDTRVVGQITSSGWQEEWVWVSDKGKSHKMKIKFASDGRGGTYWDISK